jgi:hypothetical protein
MAVSCTSTTWIVKAGHEDDLVRRWSEFAGDGQVDGRIG